MKQILVIVPFPMSNENLSRTARTARCCRAVRCAGIYFQASQAAPRNYISPVDMMLADISIFEAGMKAEQEGFDAVCIDTMSDPGVAALRSVLSIPVIGPGVLPCWLPCRLAQNFQL